MGKPLYLSGPMSGIPEFNFPMFSAVCDVLRTRGLMVLSPHENSVGEAGDEAWKGFMRTDITLLMQCEGIVLLPGWTKSKGARLELIIALGLDMPVWFYQDGHLIDMNVHGH